MAISSPLQSCASTWVALYMTPAPSKRESSARVGFRYLATLAMTTVPRRRGLEFAGQPGYGGQGLDGGIPPDLAPPAHDRRHVADPDLEAIEECLPVRLALQLVVGEGLTVTAQELPDFQGASRMPRADEHQAAAGLGDERHAPQNEGAHEDLAELEVPLHESAQVLAIDHDDGSVVERPSAHEVPARGQHVDLAREFPGTEHRDPLFTPVDGADDFAGALDDHEEAGVLLVELV